MIEIGSTDALEDSHNASSIQHVFVDRKKPSSCAKFFSYLFPRVRFVERKILNNSQVFPKNYISNKIDNTKYNFFTFLPLVFFHQFKHFLNLYFLAIALMQLIPVLQVGLLKRVGRDIHFSNSNYHACFLHKRVGRRTAKKEKR